MTLLWVLLSFSMTYPLFSGWEELKGWAQIWEAVAQSRMIPHLMPALQSYWMAIHVPVMFTSYAAFAVSFAVGIVYLIQEKELKSKKPSEFSQDLPALEPLDRMIYRLVCGGFPLLTLGVILGARGAYDAWGRYWGWDPKETWALITLLWFLAILHGRFAGWLKGTGVALATIGGFLLLLMTYYGVSFYLVGLHSYAGGHAKPLPPLLLAYLAAELAFMLAVGLSPRSRVRPSS